MSAVARRGGPLALLLALSWLSSASPAAALGVGIHRAAVVADAGDPAAAVAVSRIAAPSVCGVEHGPREQPVSTASARAFLLQLPPADLQECWVAGLSRLARPRPGAQSAYLLGENPHLTAAPAVYAYLLKRAAVALRAADPQARVLVGPVTEAGRSWLEQVLEQGILPYADGLASAPDALSGILAARDRLAPGLEVWSIEPGEEAPTAAGDALARAARALALGAEVSVVHAPSRAERAALDRFAALLAGDFQVSHGSGLYLVSGGARPLLELIGGTTGDMRIFLLPPHDGVAFRLGPPAVGRAEVLDLDSDTRTEAPVSGRSDRQQLRLQPAASFTATLLFGKADLARERVEVTSEPSLTAAEIIAREQQAQAHQRLELDGFEANVRIAYHFTISNVNESIDVVTENEAFGRDDAIEYRQRALYLNGLPWKGKPPALPFIATEKIKEVPLRIALDEGYRYELQGVDVQDGRACYRIAFEPVAADSADFRGTVWIDREVFFRVRLDLVRLRPSPPASSDFMTQWFEPRTADGAEYWLMSRTEGQMLLSALGRSIVLERQVDFADFVVNPAGFEEHRRAAHASDDPMFRDSLEEGLVALRPGGDGDERTAHSATTKSNTMLVGGWGGSVDGDVGLPFAGFNWFDLDFRGTGTQVDLAWFGPVAVLSLSWPVVDSPWQISVDSLLSAVAIRDRHSDLRGRVGAEDLKRQDELLQASFRRTLGPFFSVSIQPSLAYLGVVRNSSTDPAYLLPPGTLEGALGLRFEYQRAGYEVGLWARGTRRDRWDGFGLAGDASLVDIRKSPVHYGLQLTKSFYTRRMDRFSMDLGLWDGRELDRFSAFAPGVFPGLRVQGFDSQGLRFTRGATGDFRYALPPTGRVRIEVSAGGAVFENAEYYGEGSQYAYGGGLAVTFPGAWGTFLRARIKYGIDSSLPLDGSQGSLRLEMFKTFDGWWPWTRSARRGGRD